MRYIFNVAFRYVAFRSRLIEQRFNAICGPLRESLSTCHIGLHNRLSVHGTLMYTRASFKLCHHYMRLICWNVRHEVEMMPALFSVFSLRSIIELENVCGFSHTKKLKTPGMQHLEDCNGSGKGDLRIEWTAGSRLYWRLSQQTDRRLVYAIDWLSHIDPWWHRTRSTHYV